MRRVIMRFSGRAGYAAAVVAAVAGIAGLGPEAFDAFEALETLDALDPESLGRVRTLVPGDLVMWALASGASLLAAQRICARLERRAHARTDAQRIRAAWAAAIARHQVTSQRLTIARSHRSMAPAKRRVAVWIRRNIRSPGPPCACPWARI